MDQREQGYINQIVQVFDVPIEHTKIWWYYQLCLIVISLKRISTRISMQGLTCFVVTWIDLSNTSLSHYSSPMLLPLRPWLRPALALQEEEEEVAVMEEGWWSSLVRPTCTSEAFHRRPLTRTSSNSASRKSIALLCIVSPDSDVISRTTYFSRETNTVGIIIIIINQYWVIMLWWATVKQPQSCRLSSVQLSPERLFFTTDSLRFLWSSSDSIMLRMHNCPVELVCSLIPDEALLFHFGPIPIILVPIDHPNRNTLENKAHVEREQHSALNGVLPCGRARSTSPRLGSARLVVISFCVSPTAAHNENQQFALDLCVPLLRFLRGKNKTQLGLAHPLPSAPGQHTNTRTDTHITPSVSGI